MYSWAIVGVISTVVGKNPWDAYYNKTNYEIAYRIYEENGQVVVVIMAGTRENFYAELKNYIRP